MGHRQNDERLGHTPVQQVVLLDFVPASLPRARVQQGGLCMLALLLALTLAQPSWEVTERFRWLGSAGLLIGSSLLLLWGPARVTVTLSRASTGHMIRIAWRGVLRRRTWQRVSASTPTLLLETTYEGTAGLRASLRVPGEPVLELVHVTALEDIRDLHAQGDEFEARVRLLDDTSTPV